MQPRRTVRVRVTPEQASNLKGLETGLVLLLNHPDFVKVSTPAKAPVRTVNLTDYGRTVLASLCEQRGYSRQGAVAAALALTGTQDE